MGAAQRTLSAPTDGVLGPFRDIWSPSSPDNTPALHTLLPQVYHGLAQFVLGGAGTHTGRATWSRPEQLRLSQKAPAIVYQGAFQGAYTLVRSRHPHN